MTFARTLLDSLLYPAVSFVRIKGSSRSSLTMSASLRTDRFIESRASKKSCAGRMMLAEIDRHAAADRSFAFETTLAGHTHLRRIDAWRASGFTVELIFLSLASVEVAIARVAMRVQQGGHHVATEVIRRRFASDMRNFLDVYRYRVDFWQWFDNSGPRPRLLEEGTNR
jgi:predicted ABC-type ATPase